MFDDLDPRLSFLCQVGDGVIRPCKKSAGDARYVSRDPSICSFRQSMPSHTISKLHFHISSMFFLRHMQLKTDSLDNAVLEF